MKRNDRLVLRLAKYGPYVLCALLMLMTYAMPVLAADPGGDPRKVAMGAVLNVAALVIGVVGALFLLIGIIRFTTAHANEDGPNQQKAAMLIATGVALIVLAGIIKTFPSDQLLNGLPQSLTDSKVS